MIYRQLKEIYKLRYLLLNLVLAFLYYLLITAILAVQAQGLPFTPVPLYLIYILSITSSVLLTIAVYSIFNTTRNAARFSATAAGTITALAGSIVAGCGCSGAILFSLMAVFLSSSQAFLINTIATENASLLLYIMIIINLSVIIYYIRKLSKPECKISKKSV